MKLQTKWTVLILAGLTNALVVAMPGMAMPVLFNEISHDLSLSLVQVGVIWGISSLPGILTGVFGGAVVDRFGPRRVAIVGVVLVGITGALRGFSNGFVTLFITSLLAGFLPSIINMCGMKNCRMWFPNPQLGLANGVLSMGMALGFLLGSLLSATVLSPLLGGWRNVMFFYGGLAVLFCIPWVFTLEAPISHPSVVFSAPNAMSDSIRQVVKIKDIWLLCLGLCGIGGCVTATLGYLPLYLHGMGWSDISADGALSTFHLMSLVFVLPISILSDRVRSRKIMALLMGAITVTGVGLLSASGGTAIVWVAVIVAGLVRDGFMGVSFAMTMETEGIGALYAGTAVGLMIAFSTVGGMLAAPIGNSLASVSPALPFLFWAALAAAGIASISQTRRYLERPVPATSGE